MRDFFAKNLEKKCDLPLTYTAVHGIIIVSGGRYRK
nr:MAG TPA: hypothetical protein [Bacteriophage sp.]